MTQTVLHTFLINYVFISYAIPMVLHQLDLQLEKSSL